MSYAKIKGKAHDIELFHDVQDRPCTSFWITDDKTTVPCLVIGKMLDIKEGDEVTAEGYLDGTAATIVMEVKNG